MSTRADDERWMRAALSLARRGLGRTWPNPTVGCVIVRNGIVVGQGWTQPEGRPHAETEALATAGAAAAGATAYVSLEPCSHHGRTPPCSDALIAAGIARVVIACGDPDPRVSGRGIAALREAGLAVTVGTLEAAAERMNAGFLKRLATGLPWVTLKVASSLDARIATHTGDSQWITGPEARRHGHYLRASHDAIMVGRRTAEADDPSLTCRLAGMEDRSPVRIVVNTNGTLRASLKLFTSPTPPTWQLVARGRKAPPSGTVIETPLGEDGQLDLRAALALIAEKGITRLLVEGGSQVAASLLTEDLVDQIAWFTAPVLVGGDGLPAIGPLAVSRIADMRRFALVETRPLGADIMALYERA
jgi:diaminohydroxyphosphoribosylaminopyrimidine deaminase / 5-amino-6-(5-phosphoribosylamino)uracil reductase